MRKLILIILLLCQYSYADLEIHDLTSPTVLYFQEANEGEHVDIFLCIRDSEKGIVCSEDKWLGKRVKTSRLEYALNSYRGNATKFWTPTLIATVIGCALTFHPGNNYTGPENTQRCLTAGISAGIAAGFVTAMAIEDMDVDQGGTLVLQSRESIDSLLSHLRKELK